MDRSGEFSKGAIALIVLLSLVFSGMAFLGTAPVSQGAVSDEKDDYGYYWMDNKNPDPKVDYQWINVRNVGTELEVYDYYYGYDDIVLPSWSFPLYGIEYDTIYVGSRGLIWFEDMQPTSSYSTYPDSNEPNPSIAVCLGYPYTTYTQYGGVHYLTGTDSIGKFVCIEWNSNYYGMTYEAILWETGLIKFQYNNMGTQSTYNTGQYMSVGIEDETASTSLIYSSYSTAGLHSGLAIEISTEETALSNFALLDGGGPNNHTAYAELQDYEFSFDVNSSAGYADLSQVRVYFGPPSLGIYVRYDDVGGLRQWSVGGGGQYYIFDSTNSTSRTTTLNDFMGINGRVIIKFLFGIPLDGNISVTLWGRGKTALPKMMEVQDAFYLDSTVKLEGELIVYNEAGLVIPNEAFTRENENITFSGIKVVYNSSMEVYPPNSSFVFRLVDDELQEFFDYNASGRNLSRWYVMPGLAIRKVFIMTLRYGNGDPFPAGKLIGEFPPYAFRVDDSTPIAPASLVLRADSFKDTQREFDNDNAIFISWSSVKDSGSGVVRYRIWTTYAPGDDNVPFVDSKVTQFIWNGTTEGVFRVFIWAEDGVGHAGEWKEASIIIDKRDPFFTEFSPNPYDVPWLKTLTPALTIEVKDNLTISDAITGVRPSTIEYSTSTTGIDNFDEWISADLHDDDSIKAIDTIDVKLSPRFVEGKENFIKYRAKDYAGNGFAYSEVYNLNIDVTPVEVQDFFPTPNVWHDLEVINERDIECYLYDETSGIMTNSIYYRIGSAYDEEANTHTWESGIPQLKGWEKLTAKYWDRVDGDKLIYIHLPWGDFKEGDQNFIQFMFRDVAGNGQVIPYENFPYKMTYSQLYQIQVNTQPIAMIAEPQDFDHFNITEMVTFDASDSYDIDVDEGNLKFEWFVHELNKTVGYDQVIDTVRFPAKGWYNITLYVSDSVHRYNSITGEDKRSSTKVLIYIDVPEIEPGIDSDNDNMEDLWEYNHFLTIGFDDSDEDADNDGFKNIDEYNGDTDPWDPVSKPSPPIKPGEEVTDGAPFQFWVFMVILVVALIIAAIVVLFGYLRIHKHEQQEQTEEAEEEAMLATPQLDIPTMPQMPILDPAAMAEMPAALPPAEQVPPEGQPLVEEPVPAPAEPAPMEPAPVDGYQEPPAAEPVPAPVDPMYEQPQAEAVNPMYQQNQ